MKKQTNIPALRFPTFEGEWERKKIGEICDFIVPARNKPTKFDGDIPWITTPDIKHNGIITTSKIGLAISKEEAKKSGAKIVPANSIIMSCVGELGLVAVSGKEIIINQQLHAFMPKENINYRFLLYALSEQRPYMDKVATKTAVPYMNKDNCNSIPISFPTLPEQQKIASFLSLVDKKIAQLNQKKKLLQAYKKGVMQKLFSQEIRFKDENGNEFEEWEMKTLGEIAKFYSGGTPLTTKREYYYGTIPFIKSGEINADATEQFISEEALKNSSAKLVNKGDILYALYGATSGEVAISKIYGAINQAVLCIKSNQNHFYIYSILKFQKESIIKTFLQGGQGNLSAEIIKNLILPFPCLAEQTKIANFLSVLDEKINYCSKEIAINETFKKGLLQQLFC